MMKRTLLFASACHNPDHVLSHRWPPKKEWVHALRPRVHDRVAKYKLGEEKNIA